MKPYQLIAALMQRQGLGALPLAKAMGKPKLQPQIHRFIRGEVREPARTTAEPIAAYFGIPTEAIYSEALATQVARDLDVSDAPELPQVQDKPPPQRVRVHGHVVSDEEWALLQDVRLVMSDDQLAGLRQQAALLLERAASVLESRKTSANAQPAVEALPSVYTKARWGVETPDASESRKDSTVGHKDTNQNVVTMQGTPSVGMGDRAKRAPLNLNEEAAPKKPPGGRRSSRKER